MSLTPYENNNKNEDYLKKDAENKKEVKKEYEEMK